MPSGQRKALTGSWPLFSRRRTAARFLLTFWGASQKVRRCKSAKRLLATRVHQTRTRGRLYRAPPFCALPPTLGQSLARRAVIRKPGPRACFKRRSAARLSLPRQTCRQGSERRLQALGHCFRAAAPQAHFLLTFWGASQKVRRCKSAKRSPTTGKTPDADARPKPTALLPLPLIHKKKSVYSPAKSPTSPRPSSSPHPPTLGQFRPEERSFGNRGLEPVSSAEAQPD
ncbi:hypothetical protein EDC59_1141 [Pseudodesulfovibrio indicus]|uniref:Uncharacterized protein n=1 Tax=Pseudodesulfovibrio indicus TaxID=1716143 RepID=A0AA94PR23_9BACT|nr:hypothetical protein EDC59_1141 [Pseudodesulfovibrio indicus]